VERTGRFDATTMLLALAAAVLLQVISNLQNDVGYTTRGAERHGNRTGLPRATANGWLEIEQVRRAIVICCGLTLLLGVPLVIAHGWPVLAMGLSSLVAALAYMGGRVRSRTRRWASWLCSSSSASWRSPVPILCRPAKSVRRPGWPASRWGARGFRAGRQQPPRYRTRPQRRTPDVRGGLWGLGLAVHVRH